MRINRLTIDNIRNHEHTELALARLSVFRGPNGAGKSTIEQALEFLFTGRAEVTGAGGKGQALLLREGADKAKVVADFESGSIRATYTPASGRTTATNGLLSGVPTALDSRVWSCCINNRYFVDLSDAEQKALLASVILPTQYDFPADLRELAEAAGIHGVNWALPPAGVIDKVYDAAFKARTEVNRDVKNFVLPVVPEAQATVADIRAHLQKRREEHSALRAELAKHSVRYQQAMTNHEKAVAAVAKTEAKIQAEEQAANALQGQLLSKEEHKKQAKIAASKEAAMALDARMVELNAVIQALTTEHNRFQLLDEKPHCPMCSQVVTSELVAMLAGPVIEQKDRAITELRAAGDARKTLGDWERAELKLADHKRATEDLKRIEARIADLRTTLADAQAVTVPAEPDTSEIDAQLQALDARIEKGQEALEQAVRREKAIVDLEAAKARFDALQGRLTQLESLVETFGPKGIKCQLIDANIGAFQDSINSRLHKWGYHAVLELEPYGFKVTQVQPPTGPNPLAYKGAGALQLRQLSKSERYRFGVAFQVALALHVGLGFVVVDEADVLDQAGRSVLYMSLLNSGLDQAIVLATDERKECPSVPDSIFYRMNGGQAELLKDNTAVAATA